jgi:heme O synthase-like polyprenyltransferase
MVQKRFRTALKDLGGKMGRRENNDRNKPHGPRKRKFQQIGRLVVFSGLLLSAVGGWIYLFNHSSKLFEIGLAIIGIGVLIIGSSRFWDWRDRGPL